MTVPTDPFLFVNGTVADATQVNARYALLYAALNGALDTDNLLDTINEKLGLTKGALKRRGKAIIPANETRTNVAYGTLPTPDQVTGIVLPTDGLLFVAYQAVWAESVVNAARAAIFVGANQLKIADASQAAPIIQEANHNSGIVLAPKTLHSATTGLASRGGNPVNYTGDVSTGQILGGLSPQDGAGLTAPGLYNYTGFVTAFAAAGTYTISVQFKASSGYVTAANRSLWVWTMGF